MAALERPHELGAKELEQKKETIEVSRADIERGKEKEKQAIQKIDETLEPVTTSYEIVQTRKTIESFKTIETTNDIGKLKELLNNDPDLKLSNIPSGSRILTVFQGGPESLSIKHLNDKVLGMQGTNDLIEKRQKNIAEALQKYGLITPEQRLSSTYKLDKFQITDGQLANSLAALQKQLPPEELQKLMSDNPEMMTNQMLDYILKQAEQKTQAELEQKIALKISHIKEQIDHTEKLVPRDEKILAGLKKKLADFEKWRDPNHLRQFTLNFGVSKRIVSEPGSTEAFAERIFADQQGEAWARVNSQRIEGSPYESERRLRGSNYNPEGMVADMLRTESLRSDPDLQKFFEEVDGQKLLKLDAIAVLRKWADFEASNPTPELKAHYEKLKQYYRVLNRFDYIKNWTKIEDAQAEINQKKQLLEQGTVEQVRSKLKTNPKGTGDLTDAEFQKDAVELGNARYVTFDVVGMGNENVRSFEKIYLTINTRLKALGVDTSDYKRIQEFTANNPEKAEKIRQIFQEEGIKSGNEVTAGFKEKVAVSRAKIEQFYKEKNYSGKLISVPGGDEWTVAMPEELLTDEKQLQTLLFDIQKATNMRISVASKTVTSFDPDKKISAHKETLKNTELATEFTKKLEKVNINGVFFSQNENGSFAAALNLSDGPRTIRDADYIWPAIESLQKQGKSPISHNDIWQEYQRLISPAPAAQELANQAA